MTAASRIAVWMCTGIRSTKAFARNAPGIAMAPIRSAKASTCAVTTPASPNTDILTMPVASEITAAGLEGAAVIATDAVISLATGIVKISVFGLAGVVTAQVLAFALLIGGIAIPGAFLAKAFVERMPVHIHTAILDAAVITGGLVMISAALRSLF